jgi:hypothetical protein
MDASGVACVQYVHPLEEFYEALSVTLHLLALLLLALGHLSFAQQLPQEDQSAANVAGTWMVYTHGDDRKTGTHTVKIVQNGNTLTGHLRDRTNREESKGR